jgi:hypothetical protein
LLPLEIDELAVGSAVCAAVAMKPIDARSMTTMPRSSNAAWVVQFIEATGQTRRIHTRLKRAEVPRE